MLWLLTSASWTVGARCASRKPEGVISGEARRFVFKGGRGAIRSWSVNTALGLLRLRLAGTEMMLLGEQERELD